VQNQDMEHLLGECRHQSTIRGRRQLRKKVIELYHQATTHHWDTHGKAPTWDYHNMDYSDTHTYLFPPAEIPVTIRADILRAIANFYRYIKGYRHNRDEVRLQSGTHSDDVQISQEHSGQSERSGIG
jgi:hypothetical protein